MNATRGKIAFTDIDGLTLENRIAVGKAIPDDVIAGRDNGASTNEFAAYVLETLKKHYDALRLK